MDLVNDICTNLSVNQNIAEVQNKSTTMTDGSVTFPALHVDSLEHVEVSNCQVAGTLAKLGSIGI